jgi:alanine racemase
MTIRSFARKIRRALTRREPLITLSISKENLLHNLRAYRQAYPSMKVAPVLKSNAYGHGLAVIAEILDKQDIAFFMVDSLYEARVLRRNGILSRICVMGYVRPEDIVESSLRNIDYAVTDIEQLRTLAQDAYASVRVHLKLDTGMHRQGIISRDLEDAVALIRSNPHLELVGVTTHLADADNAESALTKAQLSLWTEELAALGAAFPRIEYRHAAATKGAPWSATYPMNVIRAGMGLYGYDTSLGSSLQLLPVLEARSLITSIRDLAPGDAVGYNATFAADRPSRVANVPAGYYEGIDRGLSNAGALRVRGVAAPIVGRVSMNMTSIDVTDIPDAARGDEVTLISRKPEDPNSVLSMARLAGLTPYVILAHIPGHLYRVVE